MIYRIHDPLLGFFSGFEPNGHRLWSSNEASAVTYKTIVDAALALMTVRAHAPGAEVIPNSGVPISVLFKRQVRDMIYEQGQRDRVIAKWQEDVAR